MVNLTINGIPVSVEEGTTILEAARSAQVHIPTLCYLKDINEIGACRVCVVEVEGSAKLVTACNNKVWEGMVIHTNSPKVRESRRNNVELILSQHDCQCPTCVRSGNCSLQSLANSLGILHLPFKQQLPKSDWPMDFPLIRDAKKCIKCMRCVQVCDKITGLNIWDVAGTGSRTTVDVSGNRKIKESDCALCGQCITHCPVGALRERDDVQRALDVLADPEKITVVQVAPAVRTSWGEPFGLSREFATVKRLVAALREIGFNYIFDTNFSADLTIMEEGTEFLDRLKKGELDQYPMFTSCCPGWVRFMKSQYPDMVDQLSSAKSPQQMFGAVAKTYYAKLLDVDPSRIVSVSVMPCIAKKHECDIPSINDADAGQDVDLVLTTREISRLIREEFIDPSTLPEEEFDAPLGVGSGAGVIFGATGGVMEAALRTAYYLATGQNPDPDSFRKVRGMDGWKEAEFHLAGQDLKVAVASGLKNTRRLMEAIRKGTVKYDFVEIMACPGGCAGGGGQPIRDGEELAGERCQVLYGLDRVNNLRFSHENPSVQKCYQDYLGKPMSHLAHKLLHTDHHAWKMPGEPETISEEV
ncbi:MAG TPA: iron hydrogenase small subunit [Candidatus Pullilachnospira intestinigallinarum]|nr:iron hydrogenase small subunit [Candidatus Pullilachnospira intestinigallinarum]